MFANRPVQATVGVKSLAAARPFYVQVLGLEPAGPSQMGAQGYKAGDTVLLVYESAFAGTNQATGLTWALGADFDAVLAGLKAKGVKFERYDIPGATLEGDAYVSGAMRVAWFKDPDGNIINIGNYES